MNKFVKEQLKKCNVEMPLWDDNTTHIIIPYQSNITTISKINNYNNIFIQSYVLVEPPNFTLSHDWNNDTVPPEQYMIVQFIDTKGKMTKVRGKGFNTNIPWEGWLPNKSFEVI